MKQLPLARQVHGFAAESERFAGGQGLGRIDEDDPLVAGEGEELACRAQ